MVLIVLLNFLGKASVALVSYSEIILKEEDFIQQIFKEIRMKSGVHGYIIIGEAGTGKSYLAMKLANKLIWKNKKGVFELPMQYMVAVVIAGVVVAGISIAGYDLWKNHQIKMAVKEVKKIVLEMDKNAINTFFYKFINFFCCNS